MMRIALSPAASGLLRALLGRAGVSRERVLLTEVHSVDWRSLTFSGERHELRLRIPGPDAEAVEHRLCKGLEDAEFDIPGHVLVDIALQRPAEVMADGAIAIAIEALTIAAD